MRFPAGAGLHPSPGGDLNSGTEPTRRVPEISAESAMREVLEAYPGARRALFQRYHIGGCSFCGFSPDQTLTEVFANHNVLDLGTPWNT